MAFTFGLIGEKLGHSFSQQIHRQLGDYSYELHPLPPQELGDFLRHGAFRGLNVTIPYKQAVIPYCAQLTEGARLIGSVNTILRLPDGTLRGDNTDLYGLEYLARRTGINMAGKKVVILGTGGTSLTAQAAAKRAGAREILVVSRRGPEAYEGLAARHGDAQILINTTPVGMFPHCGEMAADPRQFPALEGALDVIYNPLRTAFVQAAQEASLPPDAPALPSGGGLPMLVAQAKAAAEQFTGQPIPDSRIEEIYGAMLRDLQNIVLVGMPGSGKSSIGALLAQRMGRPFIDLDALVVERAGRPIPQIFAEEGEEAFRRYEAEAIRQAGARNGCVIATGGGTVLREENRVFIRQNSFVVWLHRDLEKLPTDGRPLSAGGLEALRGLLRQRALHYGRTAQLDVCNDGTPEQTVDTILEAYNENSRD